MMQVARGLAFILGHGQSIPLTDSGPFDWLGSGYIFGGIAFYFAMWLTGHIPPRL